MAIYVIKSSVLNRIAGICSFFEPATTDELKSKINTVRLENRNGGTLAIASNQKTAAIEYLNETNEPDSAAHLILSPQLLQQLFIEAGSDCVITLTTIPEMGISTLQSTSGFTISNCCYWWDDTPLKDWNTWCTEVAKKSSGAMYWNLYHIEALIKSSPSCKITFPKFIDVDKPVVLRDYYNVNWVGLFIPRVSADELTKPSELPAWWE